jgi:hypothetical protein
VLLRRTGRHRESTGVRWFRAKANLLILKNGPSEFETENSWRRE